MVPIYNSNIKLIISAAIFCSFLACFSGINSIADLFVHFRVQMALALVPMVLYLVWKYKKDPAPKLLALSIVALLLNVVCVIWATVGFDGAGPLAGGAPRKGDPDLRLLDFNIHKTSDKYAALCDHVRTLLPDVICLQEFTPFWQAGLAPIRKYYPYSVSMTRDDPFGIVILSRRPFIKSEILKLGKAGLPTAYAQIEFRGETWSIFSTHPFPPTTMSSYDLRNDQFRSLAQHIAGLKSDHIVLAGDFNCTPWAAKFMDLLADSRLVDTRRGFGLSESWPTHCWPLLIPIDHVLVSKNVFTQQRKVGPNLGSDHLPVFVELRSKTK